MKIRTFILLAGTCLAPVAFSGAAYALSSAPASAEEDNVDKDEIVVTGSNIRGITPAGGNSTAVSKQDIEARGATSVTELLDTIPQVSGGASNQGFGTGIPQVSAGQVGASFGSGTSVIKPGLRQNPGDAETGTSTLLLVNGLRTSGTGITQNVADPNTIPVSIIERVDVSLDGGSAIYGSDAIGGVMNFVTRRSFEGAEVSGKYGFAEGGYRNWDVNATVGKKWDNFSAFISYNYAGSKPLQNYKVDWFQPLDFSTGYERDLRCNTPNVQFGSSGVFAGTHYYPSTATGIGTAPFTTTGTLIGTPNVCSLGALGYKSPETERHNVYGVVAVDLSESLEFTLRGRYAQSRVAAINGYIDNPGTAGYTTTITSRNPWYRPVPAGETANGNYTVLGNFSSFIPLKDREASTFFKQWGAVGEVLARLGGDWQGKFTFNYDESRSNATAPSTDTAAFNQMLMTSNTSTTSCAVAANQNFTTPNATNLAAAQAACFNVFNPGATNPALLAKITGGHLDSFARDRIFQTRAVFDGTVVNLPGGPLKAAIGAEYFVDSTTNGFSQILPSATTNFRPPSATQKVWSVFSEANIPLVSEENATPFIRELRLSASGRYDKFNRYGGTFNPHFGVVWRPIDILALRGAWGKSFRAPTTMDVIASSPAGSQVNFRTVNQVFPFSQSLINPGVPCVINPNSTATCAGGQLTTLATIQGTSPDLKPQNGKSWSIGGDFTPVEGLRASLTYYVTTYENAFANPSLNPAYSTLGLGIYNNSAGTAITQSMIDAFIAQGSVVIGQTGTSPPATPSNIYLLADIRTVNMKFSRVSGLDYSLRYDFKTGFGKMWASINGTHNLTNTSVPYPGSPTVNNLIVSQGATAGSESGPLGRFTAQLGLSSGGFRTQLTLTHLDGFQVLPTATLFQSSVDSWNQFGLYTSYEFSDESRILSGTQISVTVNNLFNTPPPLVKSVANIAGSVNGHFGDTVGRVIQFGLRKRF